MDKYPSSKDYIRRFIGSRELLNSIERYCLWLKEKKGYNSINPIKNRVERVRVWRANSSRNSTNKLASVPHMFAEIRHKENDYLAFPTISSERRVYLPIDLLKANTIASNQLYQVTDCNAYHFSVFSSLIHNIWMKMIGGKLKTDYRYSSSIIYNNFPFPPISKTQKEELTTHTFRILEEREKHPEKTLAQLYDPDKMPDGLREAHRLNDLAVERCYRSKPFESDEERLEYLFKLYEKMIQEEKERDTLFQKDQKSRKKKKK